MELSTTMTCKVLKTMHWCDMQKVKNAMSTWQLVHVVHVCSYRLGPVVQKDTWECFIMYAQHCRVNIRHWRPSEKIHLGAKVLYFPRRRTETPLLWAPILAIDVQTWSHCSVIVRVASKRGEKPLLVCHGFSLMPLPCHYRRSQQSTALVANR